MSRYKILLLTNSFVWHARFTFIWLNSFYLIVITDSFGCPFIEVALRCEFDIPEILESAETALTPKKLRGLFIDRLLWNCSHWFTTRPELFWFKKLKGPSKDLLPLILALLELYLDPDLGRLSRELLFVLNFIFERVSPLVYIYSIAESSIYLV